MKIGNFAKFVVAMVGLMLVQTASALSIDPSGEVSGGNPGGLTIYQVSLMPSDQGSSFDLEWSWVNGGDSVSATGHFEILQYSADHFDLGITITNTSNVTNTSSPKITSFGFFADPDLIVNSLEDPLNTDTDRLTTYDQYVNFPGFQTIDICVFADGCSGGNQNHGLASGEFDNFILHMSGDISDGLVLSGFAMKFQAIDSYELPGQSVPEPGTALMLGLGLLGFSMRKKFKF